MRPIIIIMTAFIFTALIAEDYAIKLDRPVNVGYSFTINASATTKQTVKLTQQDNILQAQEESATLKLKGTVTVDAVNEKGAMTKFNLVIDSATKSRTGADTADVVLPKGAKVVADYSGEKPVILADGKSATQPVMEAVDMFFSKPDKTTDDDIFGTKERKKIKDSWDINTALASKDLAEKGMQLPAESVKGNVTLEDVKNVGDVPCQVIVATISSDQFLPPVPAWLTAQESGFTAKMTGYFPIDPKLDKCSEAMEMGFVFSGSGAPDPNTAEMVMTVKVNLKKEASYTPVK